MPALDHVNKDGTIYEIVPEIAPLFNTSTAYAVGDCVIKDAVLYRFKTAHSAGAWNSSEVDAINLGEEVTALKQAFSKYNPDLGSGYSAQLLSTVFIEDEVPYNFRTSGGSADIGDREYDEIVGVSMPINQLVQKTDFASKTSYEVVGTNNGDGTYTVNGTATGGSFDVYVSKNVKANHVYYICGCPSGGSDSTYYIYYRQAKEIGGGIIKKWDTAGATSFDIVVANGVTANNLKFTPQFFDLTLMLGTTIADYVYDLEQSTAGSGVTWLKHHFPKIFDSGYIPYNAGEMQSVSGLSAHRMTGFNQWDEQWEAGAISASNGQPTTGTNQIRSKNYTAVLPDTTYYCKAPSSGINFFFYDVNKAFMSFQFIQNTFNAQFPTGCRYIKISTPNTYGTTYKNDICINLHWDGERDGQYEEYKEYEYALDDSVVLRGILKLDSNNSLYADGDRYLPDGSVVHRYKTVTLDGTEEWTMYGEGKFFAEVVPIDEAALLSTAGDSDAYWSNKYLFRGNGATGSVSITTDKRFFGQRTLGRFWVYDSSYTTVDAWKAALVASPMFIVYPLATPTTETAEPYQTPQIVDDWGIEEYVSTSLVPVGHDTKYANNLRAKLEMSPDSPEENGDYIVRHSNGENEYVALGSTTTIQGILDRLTALENA